tara:strand:- start:1209 stop:1406 length:198 start_codon:yes stop_codon:yes gene_type:complete
MNLLKELELNLKENVEYKKSDIIKILYTIKNLDEIQLSLYSKIRRSDDKKLVEKEYYEKKLSLNK